MFMQDFPFIPYLIPEKTENQQINDLQNLFNHLDSRRSVRFFSEKKVPRSIIETVIKIASTAPSGAHKQPWTFCAISNNELKAQIKVAAEAEEKESYEGRMSDEWLTDLAPIGTDWQKPFLTIAPWIIVVFRRSFEFDAEGKKHQNYYVQESVGLACGMLLTAIRTAGLASLTHTPSPMNFLTKILNRPENEKPFLLIPIGYAAIDCMVPDLQRKPMDEVSVWYE
jgi:iodotyrosine deiodinase